MAVGWGTAESSDALTLTNSYQDIQDASALLVIDLDPNQYAHVQVEVDFQTTPSNDGEWQILSSTVQSGSTPVWDTDAIDSGLIDNATDPARQSSIIHGPAAIKIQGRQTGAADTTNSMTVRWRIATMS